MVLVLFGPTHSASLHRLLIMLRDVFDDSQSPEVAVAILKIPLQQSTTNHPRLRRDHLVDEAGVVTNARLLPIVEVIVRILRVADEDHSRKVEMPLMQSFHSAMN